MNLWNPLHRSLVAAAGIGVLAMVSAVAARGQDTAGAVGQAAGSRLTLESRLPGGRASTESVRESTESVRESTESVRERTERAPKRTASAPERMTAPTVSVATLRVPPRAWKHFDRASSAAEHHRAVEFERESAKALEIAPEFAQMYMLRATVEVNAQEFADGIESVQTALRFDPGTVWARVVLAGAYNGMHRFPDALLVLNAQRGRECESWQAMYERARAEIGAHETSAALHWSGLMLEAAPREFEDAHLVRANALVQAGRMGEAADQLTVYLAYRGVQTHRAEALALRDALSGRHEDASSR